MAETKFIVFKVGAERYGLPIDKVERILPIEPITKLPRTPKVLLGMFDLRGTTVPVLDARIRFDLPEGKDFKNLVVVLSESGRCALRVDTVEGIFGFEESEIDPPQTVVTRESDDFVSGVGRKLDQLVVLLDPDAVVPQALRSKCAA